MAVRFQDRALAEELIRAGLKNSVITLATGLSRQVLQVIRTEVPSPLSKTQLAGALSSPHRFLSTRRRLIEASLFMSLYDQMAQAPRECVDYQALMASYAMFRDFFEYTNPNNPDVLDVNDCFVLAREYRTSEDSVALHYCGNCGASYITVKNQRVCREDLGHQCPMCSLAGESKVKSPGTTPNRAA
jgi:flagellar transcriptional activator FlhC